MRATCLLLLAAAGLGCAGSGTAPGPLHLTAEAFGPDTRLVLEAAPHLKLNARLAPALELTDGSRLRFGAARRTADSAYFAEPPTAVLPGRHARVHGTLRASVCRDDEQVCRTVTVQL